VRELFDGVGDDPSLLEPELALGTRANVGFQGGNAKTLLIIEEEVDLGRK
jgi:hypothetical protein